MYSWLPVSMAIAAILTAPVLAVAQGAGAQDHVPIGYVDRADGTAIAGWARDPRYDGPIPVQVYVDDVQIDELLASDSTPEFGAHAFRYLNAPFGFGPHRVTVTAVGVDGNGVPDGTKTALPRSDATGRTISVFDIGCDRLSGDAYVWCRDLPDYWKTRQQDTKLLRNKNIEIGINNSFGGAIMQLYGADRSTNLIDEHGGGAVQLSLWGYDANNGNDTTAAWFGTVAGKTDPTPYPTQAACLQRNAACRAYGDAFGKHVADGVTVKACGNWGAGAPWNPLQAQAPNCANPWITPANHVTYRGDLPDGGYEIKYADPANFTKSSRFLGLTFDQKVTLGDAYAKIEYTIDYAGRYTTIVQEQETPAFFTSYGINDHFYYYDGSAPFTGDSVKKTALKGDGLHLGFPAKSAYPPSHPPQGFLTEGWWSVCDATDAHCVTAASFASSADEAALGGDANAGYIGLLSYFGFHPGLHETIALFVFPYKYDAVVDGTTIRQRIYDLHKAAPATRTDP
jgi:hypothetical protein